MFAFSGYAALAHPTTTLTRYAVIAGQVALTVGQSFVMYVAHVYGTLFVVALAAIVPVCGLIQGVDGTPPELTICSPAQDWKRYTTGVPPQLMMLGSVRSLLESPVWIFEYACPRIDSMI